jgi:hypothetical protein
MKSYIKKLLPLILAFLLCLAVLSGCSYKAATNMGKSTGADVTGAAQGEDAGQNNEDSPAADSNSGNTADSGSDNTDASSDSGEAAEPEESEEPEVAIVKSDAVLTLSQGSGVYDQDFDLTLTCDKQAEIYYTTDGSDPVTSSTRILYSSPVKIADRSGDPNVITAVDPFLYDAANVMLNAKRDGFLSKLDSKPSDEDIDKCTVIRAVGIDSEGAYTDVITNTYFVGSIAQHVKGIEESCKASGTSLAIISLSINYEDLFDSKTGIYVKGEMFDKALKYYLTTGEELSPDTSRRLPANYNQKGMDWERNVHVDFFESDGSATTCGISQDCGIRIQGNYSRSDLQKGFRLFARNKYGKNAFEYPVFGEDLKDDAGQTMTKFKSLTLRNGGNCAFTTKYSDTYWQSLIKEMDCETLTSRPCVVYVNGEYWGLYVLQEDYSSGYFEYTHGVNADDVILYKGDAEVYESTYKLDLGELPKGETDDGFYFKDLMDFFRTHSDLTKEEDYQEFAKLVDVESFRDYFAVEIWINNKWDWPGKNWSLWKTKTVDESNPYADGRWRFCFYDVEFGGVSGRSDAFANTIKEDNYKPLGLLDKDTPNPAVLSFAYLMTNADFRKDFAASLLALSDNNFKYDSAMAALNKFKDTYSPLYDQFFARYRGTGDKENSNNGGYASYQCIADFLKFRADRIQPMLDYVNSIYPN